MEPPVGAGFAGSLGFPPSEQSFNFPQPADSSLPTFRLPVQNPPTPEVLSGEPFSTLGSSFSSNQPMPQTSNLFNQQQPGVFHFETSFDPQINQPIEFFPSQQLTGDLSALAIEPAPVSQQGNPATLESSDILQPSNRSLLNNNSLEFEANTQQKLDTGNVQDTGCLESESVLQPDDSAGSAFIELKAPTKAGSPQLANDQSTLLPKSNSHLLGSNFELPPNPNPISQPPPPTPSMLPLSACVVCKRCSRRNELDANFCSKCGVCLSFSSNVPSVGTVLPPKRSSVTFAAGGFWFFTSRLHSLQRSENKILPFNDADRISGGSFSINPLSDLLVEALKTTNFNSLLENYAALNREACKSTLQQEPFAGSLESVEKTWLSEGDSQSAISQLVASKCFTLALAMAIALNDPVSIGKILESFLSSSLSGPMALVLSTIGNVRGAKIQADCWYILAKYCIDTGMKFAPAKLSPIREQLIRDGKMVEACVLAFCCCSEASSIEALVPVDASPASFLSSANWIFTKLSVASGLIKFPLIEKYDRWLKRAISGSPEELQNLSGISIESAEPIKSPLFVSPLLNNPVSATASQASPLIAMSSVPSNYLFHRKQPEGFAQPSSDRPKILPLGNFTPSELSGASSSNLQTIEQSNASEETIEEFHSPSLGPSEAPASQSPALLPAQASSASKESSNSSVFGFIRGMFKGGGQSNSSSSATVVATVANLGEENAFEYDGKNRQWVKRKATTASSDRFSAPESKTAEPSSYSAGPPLLPMPSIAGSSSSVGSAASSSSVSSRPARYVDLIQQQQQQQRNQSNTTPI